MVGKGFFWCKVVIFGFFLIKLVWFWKGWMKMLKLKQKGVDFDIDGRKWTLEELVKVGGFMALKDVKDRLPMSYHKVKAMRYGGGEFAKCFCNPFKDLGEKKGAVYVNIDLLNNLLSQRLEAEE
jgi:hypothetical protein